MLTQKQVLDAHRFDLDAAFASKYPDGQFSLSVDAKMRFQQFKMYGLHWCPKRRTSHVAPRGVSVHNIYGNCQPGISHGKYRSDSIDATVRHYTTLHALLGAARRAGCPVALVDAFVNRYDARAGEGF